MGNDTRCTIEGCEGQKVARGWCNKHWKRWRSHGNPEITLMPTMVRGTADERFWAKVDASGDCWEWDAHKDKDGYGILSYVVDGRSTRAHKFAWQTLVGVIKEGMELDHLCRNRGCCNPDHLEPVTHEENMRRTSVPGVKAKIRGSLITHCPRNHEYTPGNTVIDGGRRKCRTCLNDRTNKAGRERRARTKRERMNDA